MGGIQPTSECRQRKQEHVLRSHGPTTELRRCEHESFARENGGRADYVGNADSSMKSAFSASPIWICRGDGTISATVTIGIAIYRLRILETAERPIKPVDHSNA
jgi:hypothetical protein